VFNDCPYNKDIPNGKKMIAPGTAPDATVVSIQFQDYTFDLRSNEDMAPVFHKMSYCSTLNPYPPF